MTLPAEIDVEHPLFGGVDAPEEQSDVARLLIHTVDGAMWCWGQGIPITPDAIVAQDSELRLEAVQQVMVTRRFRETMREAGVEWEARRLTREQRAFLAMYYSLELVGESRAKKLAAAGVSAAKFNGWMKSPAFSAEFYQTAEELFAPAKADALGALQAQIEQGDMRAIKLGLEVTGRHDPDGAQAQFQNVLRGIYVILDQGLRDHPEVMAQIGALIEERLPSLMNGAAGQLPHSAPRAQLAPQPEPARPILTSPPAGAAIMADDWVVDLSAPNLTPPDER